MSEIEAAVKKLLAFGKPCEGSRAYKDAWQDLSKLTEKTPENRMSETLKRIDSFLSGELL